MDAAESRDRTSGDALLVCRVVAVRVTLAILVVASLAWAQPAAAPRVPAEREPLPGPLLGIVRAATLVRVDPRSLRPLASPKVALGRSTSTWSFAPGRSKLVAAGYGAKGRRWFLRFVDVRKMRLLWTVPLRPRERVLALAWLAPRRAVAVTARSWGSLELLVLDPVTRRLLATRPLPIEGEPPLLHTGRTPKHLVLLASGLNEIEPARLLVVDPDGAAREVTLARILAGRQWRQDPAVSEYRIPALAVDPDGDRAFVLAPGAPVAVIDLNTLSVAYHDLRQPISLLGRLRAWLEPAAQAKATDGPIRYARWLGDGLIGLTGSDDHTFVDANGVLQMTTSPAGLALVDVRDWTVRTLDATSSFFRIAEGLLFATGWSWDSASQTQRSFGVAVYGPDGGKRFHLFPGTQAYVEEVFAGRAYVRPGRDRPLAVVDLNSGRIIGHRRGSVPSLLLADASPS